MSEVQKISAYIKFGKYCNVEVSLLLDKEELGIYLNADSLTNLYKRIPRDFVDFDAKKYVVRNEMIEPRNFIKIEFEMGCPPQEIGTQWVQEYLYALFDFFQLHDNYYESTYNRIVENVEDRTTLNVYVNLFRMHGMIDTNIEVKKSRVEYLSFLGSPKKIVKKNGSL